MPLRIALGQFNATVGDIAGNARKMRSFYDQAVGLGVAVLVFPEMCICGYPPEDLLYKNHFLADTRKAVDQLAADCPKITIIAGFAEADADKCFNAMAVLHNGKIEKIYRKALLPNYEVFDEQRYFQPGSEPVTLKVNGFNLVLTICEDIWELEWLNKFLKKTERKDIIINISASPFNLGKIDQRRYVLSRCAKHFNCALAYCNLVGGQDELVFDGRSMLLDSAGAIVSQAKAFAEDLLIADIDTDNEKIQIENVEPAEKFSIESSLDPITESYLALVLGTKDYIEKNGFKRVVIGLSGGIDSSLTAVIAVDALGAENVVGVTMPSKFNKAETINDAEKLADNLGITLHTVPIESVLDTFNETLNLVEGWDDSGVAFENLQARIRGTILMSLSNQLSLIVLTTGNKSETSVGYTTLYGDTAGGFAVIKDVPKTMVYELAEFVNENREQPVIPASVIERPPSAELRDNQKDSDSLPDYDLLDKILKGYIEEDKSAQQLAQQGLPKDIVDRVARMVDLNEYKRRQSPPGVKITPKAFGKDRRMPITNRYRPK